MTNKYLIFAENVENMRNLTINKIVSIAIITILTLVSCSKSFSPSLKEADKILFTNHQKGEILLDSICQATPNMSTADKMYYQLLKLKAADKAFRPINNQQKQIDSLVSYFQHSSDNDILAEAYFYAGRVYYEMGDKPKALKFFQKAHENVAKNNHALLGDIYCQMANVYKYTDLDKEALNALKRAYQADSLSQHSHNMLYDLRDIGEIYYDLKDMNLATKYFLKGLNMSKALKDSFMIRSFHHELAVLCVERKEWGKALAHVEQYIHHIDNFPNNSGMVLTALKVYKNNGNKESFEECVRRIMASDNIFVKQEVYEDKLLSQTANNSQLTAELRTYIQYTDSVIDANDAEAVKKVEELYNYNLKEQENEKLKTTNRYRLATIIIIATLLIVVLLISYLITLNARQTKKLMKFKLDKYKSLALAHNEHKKTQQEEIQSIHNNDIYKFIVANANAKTYKLSTQDWEELKRAIDSAYPYFNERLKELCSINEQDFKMCLLLKIGIRPIDIAGFTNRSKEAITSARRRLYEKAFHVKGTPQNWDNTIRSL